MDKNAIKTFATWARVELIDRVSQKAEQYGVTEKNPGDPSDQSVHGRLLTPKEQAQRTELIARVKANGWQQTMEEVAYTWFNRFCALRYMEVNGYLPSHVRVFTDEKGAFKPQLLSEAIHIELKGIDKEKVYQHLDRSENEELYKYLLIMQCNALSDLLPQMFQRIEDFTELLLPDNLLREGSVVEQMVTLIPEDDWKDQVQIIGWLYQYYNAEPKDQVYANLKKNIKISKHDIPAATQLFTPDWIVRYMVENSLGRLWIERKRVLDSSIDEKATADDFGWKYYMEEAEQEPDVQARLATIRESYKDLKPEDIRCIDPCMGSGHILAYMFDVLMQIYQDYGYATRDAVRSILKNNLYGLDIDDRAAQLSYFAVMMKAREYDRRLLSRIDKDGKPDIPQPNVYPIMESNSLDADMIAYFAGGDAKLKKSISALVEELNDAKEYGSILTVSPVNFDALYARFEEVRADVHFYRDAVMNTLLPFVRQAQLLAQVYDVVVTNPPYMGSRNMNADLAAILKEEYPDSKSDLFAAFMERGFAMTKTHGFTCMVTMQSWMFLSSYEKMRLNIINNKTIVNLMHMENMVLGIAFGTAVANMRNTIMSNFIGTYNHITMSDIVDDEPYVFHVPRNRFAKVSQDNFTKIPGAPVAYWVGRGTQRVFQEGVKLEAYANARQGMKTLNNEKFIRNWHEVCRNRIKFDAKDADEAAKSGAKWFPINHGGEYRRHYGNHFEVVNWENDGCEIKKLAIASYGTVTRTVTNIPYFFQEGITWTVISSGSTAFRRFYSGHLFSNSGQSIVPDDKSANLDYLIAMLNSVVSKHLLSVMTPTLGFESGYLKILPILVNEDHLEEVESLSCQCIQQSRIDWDSFETSWDFKHHPMINNQHATTTTQTSQISDNYSTWKSITLARFAQLKANEEALNRIFIDIYGLQDELSPEVEDKDVTVYRIIDEPDEEERKMRYVLSKRDAIITLISYAVGCMFGRYSLDEEGLILAGQPLSDKFVYTNSTGTVGGHAPASEIEDCYIRLQDGSKRKCSFAPDYDNIIPITDEGYFSDDIVTRFAEWVSAAYGEETLEENLHFVADALGGSGTPRDIIRNYFLKDFYNDHKKTYKKRPIYWLFDSGRRNGFKALIYMHRYAPDTIARLRTDYVHELQSRYDTEMASLTTRMETATTAKRTQLNRKLNKITNQAEELRIYEEKIHHLADQMIEIDLDDGVNRNYAIFKDVLAKI